MSIKREGRAKAEAEAEAGAGVEAVKNKVTKEQRQETESGDRIVTVVRICGGAA